MLSFFKVKSKSSELFSSPFSELALYESSASLSVLKPAHIFLADSVSALDNVDAVATCKSTSVHQAVINKKDVRVMPDAVTFTPLTFSLLRIFLSDKNECR